ISYIHRLTKGHIKAFPLPYGIKWIAFMFSDDIALLVYKISPIHFLFQPGVSPFQESPVIVIGNKADFVRFAFFSQLGISVIQRHLADFGSEVISKRESGTAEQVLFQSPEHITLVFGLVFPFGNKIPSVSRILPHMSIMPGGDEIASQRIGPFQQSPPLDVGITHYARVGCSAGKIFLNEIINHKSAEFIADIQDIMRKSMLYRRLACIVERINIAASGLLLSATTSCIVPGFHGNSYHFISLVLKHKGSNGTVDTTTHSHQNFSFSAHDS